MEEPIRRQENPGKTMKVKRIKLDNYCQHRDLEVHLHGRLVGFLGESGSGKTNLASCIHEAITGKFRKTKEGMITFGETKGSVEVEMEVGGSVVTIYRELHGSGCRLSVILPSGEEAPGSPFKTADRVNAALAEIFPYPASVLRGVVFTPQEDITSLLFDPKASVRERMAASFFGADKAEEAEKAVAEVLSSIPIPSPPRGYRPPEEIESDIAEALKLYNERGEGAAKLRELFSGSEMDLRSKAETAREAEAWIQACRERSDQDSDRRELVRTQESLITIEREIAEIEESMEGVSIEGREDELEIIQERRRAIKSLREAEERLAEEEEAFAVGTGDQDLRGAERRVEEASAKLRACLSDLGRVESRKAARQALVDLDEAECPTCMRGGLDKDETLRIRKTIHSLAKKESALIAESEDLQAAFDRAERDRRQIHSRREKEAWDLKLARDQEEKARRRLADCEAEILARHGKVREEALILKVIDALRKAGAELSAKKSEWTSINSRIHDLNHRVSKDLGGSDLSRFSGMDEAMAAIKAEKETLEVRNDLAAKFSEASEALANIDRSLDSLKLDLEASNAYLEDAQASESARTVVSGVRMVFHYSAAPKKVVSTRLKAVSRKINGYLETFGARFHVDAKEGFDFDCVYGSRVLGKVVRPQDLSGGEKVVLSVAFRLAAAETFCSGIGFLMLDEPTVWMDKKRKENIPRVMDRLRDLAEEAGGQYLVVTHDETLLGCFDQTVELEIEEDR